MQWVVGGRFVLSSRFAASDEDHRHQFGEDVEKDRHDLLFGEIALRDPQARTPTSLGWPERETGIVPMTFRALPTLSWSREYSLKTIFR